MKTSQDRILTTHTGSLPRPAELRAVLVKKDQGEPYDKAQLSRLTREAGGARFFYRRGMDATALFPDLKRAVDALPWPPLVLDGEVTVHDAQPPTITTCPSGSDLGCNPSVADQPTCASVKAGVAAADNCHVKQINCEEGQSVQEGDVLVVLD